MSATDIAAEVDGPETAPPRLAYVQGLRGLAVLLVVIYHAGLPMRAGFVGVDIFFVISGFVITRLLHREAREHKGIRYQHFYRRRVRRLLPAFALATTATVVVSAALQSPISAQRDTAIVGFGASVWAANAALYVVTLGYFGSDPTTIPLLHTWSLAVEEQFYVVFPLLTGIGFALGRRSGRGRRRGARAVLAVALVVSFLLSILLCYGVTNGHGLAYFASPTRAWEFVAGALVALRRARRPLQARTAQVLGIVGVGLMVGSAMLLPTPLPYPGYGAVVPVAGAVLALVACRTPGTATERLLSVRPLLRIGDLSYSWYLWHWPCITFAALVFERGRWATAAAAVLSYPLARLAYDRVEQPIRHREPTARFATLRLVGVCVAVPLVLSAGLLIAASGSWGRADIEDMETQLYGRTGRIDRSCVGSTLLTERDISRCTFSRAPEGQPVVLVGDSNAWQYAEPLVTATDSLDRTLVVATVVGCPLVDVVIHQRAASWEPCREWYVAAMEWLASQPPSVVVVASANRFIEDDAFRFAAPGASTRGDDPGTKARLWQEGLVRTFEELQASGHEVLQVNVSPHLYRWVDDHVPWHPRQCTFPQLLRDVADCGIERSRAEVDEHQRRALEAEHGAADATGVAELDLRGRICGRSACSTNRGTIRLFRDGRHITVPLALELAPDFERALSEVEDGGTSPPG
jgi:peptidoglycan/LPS O-acetylase OafA/YrhL